ncbi:vomeronasal type-2 receptor 26-like [Gastrophryne carolinensis]
MSDRVYLVIVILEQFGWLINWQIYYKESCLSPDTSITFLGMLMDNREGNVVSSSYRSGPRLIVLENPIFHTCMRVLGLMVSAMKAVLYAQIQTRLIQLINLEKWTNSSSEPTIPVFDDLAIERYIQTFIFAIEEINKNPHLLPNVTLGYHVRDSCKNENRAIQSILQILSGQGDFVPNYAYHGHGKLFGVIGDDTSESSLYINQVLNIYGHPQISYGATDPIFSDKRIFPSFFQTLPSDQIQCLAIVMLLKHFNWTWIGVIVTDDYGSEKQAREFLKVAATYDICIEFVIYINSDVFGYGEKTIHPKSINIFNKSTSKVVVVYSVSISTLIIIEGRLSAHSEKTFILPIGPLSHIEPALEKRSFHGSLAFSPIMKEIPRLRQFMDSISLASHPNDYFLEHLSAKYTGCLTSNHVLNSVLRHFHSSKLHQCGNTAHLRNLSSYLHFSGLFVTDYHVYKAVYAMAHALHEMQLYMFSIPRNYSQRHQKRMYKVPVSRCSEECPKGYRRAMRPGSHRCCFNCVQCSDGEISSDTDEWSCMKCPEDQWPNDDDCCALKLSDFLSYKKDPISIVVSVITSLCFVQSSIILSVFIIYRDTPIIKANNWSLSFLLLVSIMLSFLCVLLFIGRPGHVTCMARHTLYGITSSVAISSILAKTFMVYSAFRATKPGSSWRKFIGVKLTNGLVFICSFIQALISLIWLVIAPPFPENNTHLYPDIIIIQCNEGSVLAFSLLLGYMGLLAAVSFIVAFLARHLPDSFNEAKYITFSMLVFCSVWVTFIPAYLSATGKSTVLVEIFAIISSTVGILGCIFYPKCYIILLRPELNVKNVLVRLGR